MLYGLWPITSWRSPVVLHHNVPSSKVAINPQRENFGFHFQEHNLNSCMMDTVQWISTGYYVHNISMMLSV